MDAWAQQFETDIVDLYEGDIAYMYQDTRGLVTVGKGCQVGLAEALTLPFQVEGRTATAAEIQADYARVHACNPAHNAPYYRSTISPLLPPDAIEGLVASRIVDCTAMLRLMFGDFDTWPDAAKIATLEMPWGLGMGEFQKWPHLIAALRRRDWSAAASECAWNDPRGIYTQRNANRVTLYGQVAQEAA